MEYWSVGVIEQRTNANAAVSHYSIISDSISSAWHFDETGQYESNAPNANQLTDSSGNRRRQSLRADVRSSRIRGEHLRRRHTQRAERTCRSYREGFFAARTNYHFEQEIDFYRRRRFEDAFKTGADRRVARVYR